MILFDRNALVTISPKYDQEFEADSRFRWAMDVSLPFPFPAKKCIQEMVSIDNADFEFEIHNHFDRVFLTPKIGPAIPRVWLHNRNEPMPAQLQDFNVNCEMLQSIAIFCEKQEYVSPNVAFTDADKKIKACIAYLSTFLGRRQVEAPYLTSWLVYPISFFDIGTVYHSVRRFCKHQNNWQIWATMPAISLARRLQHPLFFLDVEEPGEEMPASDPLMEAMNELLAEAQMSLFRGLHRLTVLNSYGAVEALANAIFAKMKVKMLLSNNVPPEVAEKVVEDERQRHKTEPSFLFHRGLKDCCGRSLLEEDKTRYDSLLQLQGIRHQVAHAGYKPSDDEARNGHKLACECVQWLAGVAALPVKPLFPTQRAQISGFSATANDVNAINAGDLEFLRYAFGLTRPSDTPFESDMSKQ